jgi:vanillate O-demethylase monooxygenase subunit
LQCGYHGLEMGTDGKTVQMPGQRVRGFPAIKAYAVVERYGFVWVWPGDQAQADEAKMPVFAFFDNPAWAYGGGLYHVKADYRLMIDNLMDLTHETYVHANSIGQPEIDETPCETKVEGDQVILQRHMQGIQAPPFWQMAMSANGLDPQAKVDRWQICRFTPPTHIMIDVGVALAGHGGFDAPPEVKAYSVVVDFITPETETSHWYHWGMARQFKPEDAALTDKIRAGQGGIFNEDMEMLQLQQANISQWPERKLLMLNIDSGGVQSRRIIDRLLAQENSSEITA